VLGKTAERHTSAEFVAFLTDIVITSPAVKRSHVIADNSRLTRATPSKTSSQLTRRFTCTSPHLLLMAQPGELWFGKSNVMLIARGVFTSVSDLKRKLMRYIRHYNKSPRIVKWK